MIERENPASPEGWKLLLCISLIKTNSVMLNRESSPCHNLEHHSTKVD